MDHLEAVQETGERVAQARDALKKALAKHREAILAADAERGGQGRNALARAAVAAGGLSERRVYETLGASDLRSKIRAVLKGKGGDLEERGGRFYYSLEEAESYQDTSRMDEDEYERASAGNARWIEAANRASALQHDLREAGLTFVGRDANQALADGGEVEIVLMEG